MDVFSMPSGIMHSAQERHMTHSMCVVIGPIHMVIFDKKSDEQLQLDNFPDILTVCPGSAESKFYSGLFLTSCVLHR